MIDEEPIRTVVLLVEDNIDLNLAMREILESCGYEVLAAENGVQAIRVLEEQIPDVILCDIMMPEMDGYDLLRYARSEPSLRMIPFIFLTALTSTADHRRAREIGIDDYLTKPAETADLLAAINNALRRSRFMEDELRRQSDELRARIVALLQHEFRTPLTFVLGYAELLLKLLNDATSQQSSTLVNSNELRISVTAILDGGKRLQRLIETFLLLAELQNKTIRPEETDTLRAADIWRDVVQQFTPQMAAAEITPIMDTRNRDALVTVDSDLLREALRRLVDNAIRYRRPASRKIWISIERISVYVGFRLQDEGLGMPASLIEQYSKPFEQADHSSRATSGAGLSLTLAHHVAQLHGGKLEMSSELGKGSTFTLWVTEASISQRPTNVMPSMIRG